MTDLSRLGENARGLWTRAEALTLLSKGQVRSLLRDGAWQVVLPGVYADGGIALDAEQRAFAAVLASGGSAGQPTESTDRSRWKAIAMGRTAARVWGFPLIDDDDPATGGRDRFVDDVGVRTGRTDLVITAADEGGRTRVLKRHRPTLAPLDVARRPSGLILTGRLRTLFDCARLVSHEALVCALDDALHRKLATRDQLRAYADAHRWCAGAPAFRAALERADGRAESPHETLARLLLLPHLPQLTPQVRLVVAGRLVARFDLADEAARFALEADGKAGHAGAQMVAKDRQRDRRTNEHGWHTERVTWFDVRCDQQATVDRVVAEYVQHARRLRGAA